MRERVIICVLICTTVNVHWITGVSAQLDTWIGNVTTKPIVSISGFSAGGSIAIQLYLAHSAIMRGVAVFSGIMYHCGDGPEIEVIKLLQCTSGYTNLTKTTQTIRRLSKVGLLDPLENLHQKKHYVEQGRFDYVVRPQAGKLVKTFFEKFSEHVKFVSLPHTHATPTEKCGARCGVRVTPFSGFVNCRYSAAYEGLNYIYDGQLVHPRNSRMTRCYLRDDEVEGLVEFDQKEFFPSGLPKVGMADTGFIYIPQTCRQRSDKCSLHIHLHGCLNDAMMQGKNYIKNSELLAIADVNNLIVIFPQTTFVPSSITGIFHCWDMTGSTEFGNNYWGTKRGRQLSVLYKIIERVLDTKLRKLGDAVHSLQNNV